ncbi:MAG: response regulator [Planctomycetota bacterium]
MTHVVRHPDDASAGSPPARLTVLLGDARPAWHRQVDTLLEPQGVRTVSAFSGRDVMDALERSDDRVHVAVLDENLEGMGGLQIARVLCDKPGSPPIVLLADATAIGRNVLQQALALRVFSVLNKPVELNTLLDTLARLVRRHYGNQWPGHASTN